MPEDVADPCRGQPRMRYGVRLRERVRVRPGIDPDAVGRNVGERTSIRCFVDSTPADGFLDPVLGSHAISGRTQLKSVCAAW